jgi:2-dehydro-3-deoxygluconokinase
MAKVLAFGEILLRLSAPFGINDDNELSAYYGGTESNVLVTLSGFGEATEFLSKIPDNALGDGVIDHLHHFGVGTSAVKRVPGGRLGLYFSANKPGDTSRKVTYDRLHSAIREIKPSDYDIEGLFAGISLFHVSGISLALSPACSAMALSLTQEANRRGIPVSFDFNYREALWGIPEAQKEFLKILPFVDILFGGSFDLVQLLGLPEKDPFTPLFQIYPRLKGIYGTSRGENPEPGMGTMGALAYFRAENRFLKTSIDFQSFPIIDRIGAGDAFDAGVLEVLLHRANAEREALSSGLACAILKHKVKGDVLSVPYPEIQKVVASFK